MYLDPGFGGMLVQVVVAIAAAGGVILFSLRKKLNALFSKDKNKKQIGEPELTTSPEENVVDMIDDKE